MATLRKTIALTDMQNERGAFTNDSKVLRDLIRRPQPEASGTEARRAALIEGKRRGWKG